MSTATKNSRRIQEIVLCDDLVVPVETDVLLKYVFEAVHQIEWPKNRSKIHQTVPDPVLRTLLTYAYSAGICGSEEIETAALHDDTFRYICANHFPDWQSVRAFRRSHSPWLADAVRSVLSNVIDNHPSCSSYADASLFRFLAGTVDLRAEAQRRLARSIQADSVSMD